jgi:uncharacterized protein
VKQATFRFYAELNDFLAPEWRMTAFAYPFHVSGSVKDMVEAIGVPHTEVDVILANGESVAFDYQVQDGDRISVYPVFEALDIRPLLRLRPEPLRVTRFVLDAHLGRLAAYLRMLGFDTLYRNNFDDQELAGISSRERRILLTRDRGLLKRTMVTHGYMVRETNPRRQIGEILRRFDLAGSIKPFSRCMHCNSPLEDAPEEIAGARVPLRTRQRYHEFRMCPACGRVYWKGSHYQRMSRFLETLERQFRG